MGRHTRTVLYSVGIATPVLILEKNPDRVSYSIQNIDAANFVAVAHHPQVTAAAVPGANEGQHIVAGQSVSDDDDTDRVYCIASAAGAAAVNVVVQEVTEDPEPPEDDPRMRPARAGRARQRPGARSIG